MLVLTRRQGESLRIDEHIRVTMVACSAGHVRIAIDAPESVEILREEVYDRIASANMAAASAEGEIVNKIVKRLHRATGNGTNRTSVVGRKNSNTKSSQQENEESIPIQHTQTQSQRPEGKDK